MIKRGLKRVNESPDRNLEDKREISDDFYRRKLAEAIGRTAGALDDPEIQKKVEEHFRANPEASRTPAQVVMVACQIKKTQLMANRLTPGLGGRAV